MQFCAHCGGPLTEEGVFCGSCGASNARKIATGSDSSVAGAAGSTHAAPATLSAAGISANAAAALSYLFGVVTGIIFLILDPFKQDRFVRFHAFQSIFFAVAWVVLWIVWSVFTGVFEAVTGGFLAVLIVPLDCLLAFIGLGYWALLMYWAFQGKQTPVPILGRWAEQQANK